MNEKFNFNGWERPDARSHQEAAYRGCQNTIEQEKRGWNPSVFVPEGMQPVDLVRHYSDKLTLPPFHALQLTVNKHDVECIASAMMNPNLRWRTMYHFTIAPYDGQEKALKGEWVLISGHHRLLAYLLAGVGPSEKCPLRVSYAPLAMSLFPWTSVIWGK